MLTETIKTLEEIIMRDLERGSKSWSIVSHGFSEKEDIKVKEEQKYGNKGK